MRLLLIGPLPPPNGGTTVSFQYLTEELTQPDDQLKVKIIDTNTKSRLREVLLFLQILLNLRPGLLLSVHASTTRAYVLGAYVVFLSKLLACKTQIRVFGASVDHAYFNGSSFTKRLIRFTFNYSDQVLLQTKGLIEKFNTTRFEKAKFKWFPTSRPFSDPILNTSHSGVFVYLGSVSSDKGVLRLEKATQLLVEKGYKDVRVEIYGIPEDIDIKQLQYVTYMGVLSQEQIQVVLSQAIAMVFPTKWESEGYPGALIEAMQSGCPIITHNWKYIPELVVSGFNGYLIEPDDIEGLANKMEELLNNATKREELARNALEMGKKFSSEKWNGEMFRSYIKEI